MIKARIAPQDEAGVTMIDVMVAMVVTSILAAVATGGLLHLYRMVDVTSQLEEVTSQLQRGYDRLGREISLAYDISAPGAVNGNPSVEYLTGDPAGEQTCHQLRLLGDKLQLRDWPATQAPTGGWQTLVDKVSGPTKPDPQPNPSAREAVQTARFPDFLPESLSRQPVTTGTGFMQLRVRLTAQADAATARQREFSMTFVAANSALHRHVPDICSAGRTHP